MCEFILKVRQYRICNGKEAMLFIFFKIANTPHKGTIRHIAWLHLSSFLFKTQCFYRDKKYLDPDDKHYIRRKRNNLCLVTFLKNDNSIIAVFDIPAVSTDSQVLYSYIIKVRMDTPIFYFLIFF